MVAGCIRLTEVPDHGVGDGLVNQAGRRQARLQEWMVG
jgi:hypothetical protein